MKKITLQVYGLPNDENLLKEILESSGISTIEVNITQPSDITWYQNFFKKNEDIKARGVHFNLSLLDDCFEEGINFLRNFGANTLIIPAAIEENTLIWPLSFFRRFPFLYRNLREAIDVLNFKSLRKKVAGQDVNAFSYYNPQFWTKFAEKVNHLEQLGLNVGFHNHGIEFECFFDNEMIIEHLDKSFSANIFFQLDITNLLMSGHFSIDLIQKYLHRIKSYHLRIEGTGTQDFYFELVSSQPHFFEGKELIVELKEDSHQNMAERLTWWNNLFA